MTKFLLVAATLSLLAAGGCAGVDSSYVDAKKAAAAEEPNLFTGSRVSKPTTERVIKAVGNNEYNETNKQTSMVNAIGAKSK